MRKSFLLLCLAILMMPALAQKEQLVGTWMMLTPDGQPTLYGKIFLPDGRLYGYCFNRDFTNMGTWIMGNYTVTEDGKMYIEQCRFHSDISFQNDTPMVFYLSDDSTLVTVYARFKPNGEAIPFQEQWRKVKDMVLPEWSETEWEKAYQDALRDFGRIPADGQTKEQMANDLKEKADRDLKQNRIGQALEAMSVRAELDTMRLDWQTELQELFLEQNFAGQCAMKYADRIIRLTEQQAPTPNDTTVINAYWQKIMQCTKRKQWPEMERTLQTAIAKEEASGRELRTITFSLWNLLGFAYFEQGQMEKCIESTEKSIEIIKMLPKINANNLAEAEYMVCGALFVLERHQEALERLKKTYPLFVDEDGKPLTKQEEVGAMLFVCYRELAANGSSADRKKLQKDYSQFMEDKLLCVEFLTNDNPWGHPCRCYVLEKNDWDVQNQNIFSFNKGSNAALLMKDGEIREFVFPEGNNDTNTKVVAVSPTWKEQVINSWKEYRKKHPKK